MIHTLINVFYVLVAIGMIVLILLQRGAGAQAGSGFGAGASGTVFGARGSANFLSSSTKWLAAIFFAMSLGMAYQASHESRKGPDKADLGVMSSLPAGATKPAAPAGATVDALPAPAAQPAASEPAPAAAAPTVIVPTLPAASETNSAPAPVEGSKGG